MSRVGRRRLLASAILSALAALWACSGADNTTPPGSADAGGDSTTGDDSASQGDTGGPDVDSSVGVDGTAGDSSADAGHSDGSTSDTGPSDAAEAGDSTSAGDAHGADAADSASAMDADAGTGTDAGVDATDSASAVDAEAGTGADVGAADAASDSSLSVDASGIDAGSLCTPFPDDAAPITSTDLDGSAPNPSTFTGGNIESGTYWLTSETTYGAGTTETVAQVSILDSTTQTDRSARLTNTLDAAATEYAGFGYATSGNQILLQALCNLTGLGTGYFTFSGTGPGATLTVMTSGVLDVYTKQ